MDIQQQVKDVLPRELANLLEKNRMVSNVNIRKDVHVLIYSGLILISLLIIMFTWWLDWSSDGAKWIKWVMTGFLVLFIAWLIYGLISK
jgi:hypothetical protein